MIAKVADEADREGHPAAQRGADEEVSAEPVGAEGVLPARRLVGLREVERVRIFIGESQRHEDHEGRAGGGRRSRPPPMPCSSMKRWKASPPERPQRGSEAPASAPRARYGRSRESASSNSCPRRLHERPVEPSRAPRGRCSVVARSGSPSSRSGGRGSRTGCRRPGSRR